MSYSIVLLFMLGIVAYLLNIYFDNMKGGRNDGEAKVKLSYKKKYYFLTIPEKKFFANLEKIIHGKYIIFSKVRMMDLLEVSKGEPHYVVHKNKIKSKHVDFVICDKEIITPLLAIELDGSSHSNPKRIERDNFVDEAFAAAGLPIIHIQNSDIDDRNKIFQELKHYLVPEVK